MKALRPILWMLIAGCAVEAGSRSSEGSLPAGYFRLIEPELAALEKQLEEETAGTLATPLSTAQVSAALMAETVLWAKRHPANPLQGDPKKLALALRFGDLLAEKAEKGLFTQPLNHRWDLHFWADACRLLDPELGAARREKWRRELEKQVVPVAAELSERADFPRYQSPYIRTSSNHFSLWGSGVYLAGRTLGRPDWVELGSRVMHRFCVEEQTPDGYWGEHSDAGPTTGYNNLTFTGVSLYREHSGDPAALGALRRATDFHTHFTWPDGVPVEVVNDRNRHWAVSAWGHFGFSNFPDGRRYAEFLTGFLRAGKLGPQGLARIAQSALYFHEGPTSPIPQGLSRSAYRMKAPAGMRKSGPWTLGLSALIATQAVANQFYLDRQGHLSVYHETEGMIITGANSKRQPELATFNEKFRGQTNHLPLSGRLLMEDGGDRLSLSYNTFWADLHIAPPTGNLLTFKFTIIEMGRVEDADLTLQLRFMEGESLETGKGERAVVGKDRIEIGDLGGWIRHRGWTLRVDPTAMLVWPVYPFNPYTNGPETDLTHAVAALSVPLRPQRTPGATTGLRTQEISFTLESSPSR
jgi:hypothetical protein